MSSENSDHAIRVSGLSKYYFIFDRPEDRLKQMLVPRLQRLVGATPRRYFKPFSAVQNVSFEVKRGETVGIIGRNGSGKSTLLQIVCGTLRPSEGTVDVNGRIAALLELGAGFNPEFTGRENVFVKASILGLSHAETAARFDDIARFADIGMFIDQPVKTYSSGMFVRLAFATAINVDPDILVVDEALAVGDEAFQRKCYARIEEIKSRGATILLVSHGAQTIVQLCDRAMLIDRGELILQGQPKVVVSQYQRLVNASAAAAVSIRDSIIAMRDAPMSGGANGAATATIPNAAGSAAKDDPEDDAPDFFDPHLRSKSTVSLEERGARISDVKLVTLRGKQVNCITMGREYRYEYVADFTQEITEVAFGMLIKTVQGLEFAGSTTSFSQERRIPKVVPGQSFKVSFQFTCRMLPGVYFLNAGTSGVCGGERQFNHRLLDVLMFRVAPVEDRTATGVFDIGAKAKIVGLPANRSGVSVPSKSSA